MKRTNRFIRLSVFGCFLFISSHSAQNIQRHEVISAYIYNFAKNVQWQNEESLKEFHFRIIGEDKNLLEEMTSLSKMKTLRNKTIRVSSSSEFRENDKVQLIYVTKNAETKLVDIFDKIEGKNILLVSDNFQDRKLIMINFVESSNGTISFEINKANIINQHLQIMQDMILLGGTEVDVAALYREGQQSLRALQKHTENLEKNLNQLKNSIAKMTKEIGIQKDSLDIQSQKVKEQQNILSAQGLLLEERGKDLETQILQIQEQQNILETQANRLEIQKRDLGEGEKILEDLNNQILSQAKILEEKGETIQEQKNIMYLLGIIVFLVIVLVFSVYIGYKSKQRLNRDLEIKVKERTNQLHSSNDQLMLELIERKRVEKELKNSEVLYRYMFEQNPVPMLVYELGSLEMLAVNDAFVSHYGYSEQEALSLHLTDLYPEDEKKAVAELSDKIKGHAYAGEWHHQKKDGSLISIEAHSHKFSYEERDSRIAVITDITERKKAEEKLRQSEEQFRLISENVADMIVVLDLEGKRVYSNPSYEPILGEKDLLLGTDSFEAIFPEDRERMKDLFLETVKTGVGQRDEYRLVAKDGGIHFIESQGSVIRDVNGDINSVVVVSRDITNRKKTEEELQKYRENLEDMVKERTTELQKSNNELILAQKAIEGFNKELLKEIEVRKLTEVALSESEQRLENILNYAPILVYINDLEGRYIFINKEFEKVMDLPFEEVVNKTDRELFPKERAERNISQNNKVITSRKAHVFENASLKKDGTHYYFDILFPIFDLSDNMTATCGWSVDITERKRNEEVLKEAKEKAESADRLKSAFLATMSHELRTPLNSIIGFTGILMKGIAGPLNDEQLKQLGMAKGSAKHLLDLINDVLDISKIEAGQLVVSPRPFNFANMLKKVIESIQPLADKKNLKLKWNISENVKEITSDERRVEQIVINLLNNSIKFTDRGHVEINCEMINKKIVTKVIDTGIGINKEDMNKLFKPFSQIDTGLTRNHEGTGLGLSISQKLVEKLGGTITVESEVGTGSIFTVTLPI
ncbi:MAG: DUF4154 domain-containing protein [Bacteroidetes bacterium]|nr:DUF4154 domain-containing protein [Bacteroidota bacterium]